MAETTFTFRVDEDLKAAFVEAAKARHRTGAQLLRDFMRSLVQRQKQAAEYESWFRDEVEHALREANDPKVQRIPHEDVRSH
jgi:predicted transcriptional regulator